jgi:4-diphosphocytidyl-2-C-methyl-D-erythritol kinase
MTESVTADAPAKINLQLAAGPPRADGYHPLATVYQAIGLRDRVTVRRATVPSVEVHGDGVDVAGVPTGPENLVLRAAAALAAHAGLSPADAQVAVSVHKQIPVAGGMAGGSADAAATLLACDALWGLRTPRAELLALAGSLGSDVPFCLVGHTARGTGRGELVEPVADTGEYWWVVALSERGLSTPEVFAALDRHRGGGDVPEPRLRGSLLDALALGDVAAVGDALANDLEEPALQMRPELLALLDLGGRPPALGSLLSGSGPTCLFLAASQTDAGEVRELLTRTGIRALVARAPVPGARVVASV